MIRCVEELVVVDFHWLETEPIRLTTTFGIVMSCISSIVAVSLFDQIVHIESALKYFCFQPLIICKIYIFNPSYEIFPGLVLKLFFSWHFNTKKY